MRYLSEVLKQHLKSLGFRVLKTKADKTYPNVEGFISVFTYRLDMYDPEDVYILIVARKRGKPPGWASGDVKSVKLLTTSPINEVDAAINEMKQGDLSEKAG